MKYIEENSKIWDTRSENNDTWSIPVSSETIEFAKKGDRSILLTPTKPDPMNWFTDKLNGKKILCLWKNSFVSFGRASCYDYEPRRVS